MTTIRCRGCDAAVDVPGRVNYSSWECQACDDRVRAARAAEHALRLAEARAAYQRRLAGEGTPVFLVPGARLPPGTPAQDVWAKADEVFGVKVSEDPDGSVVVWVER